MDGSRHRRNLDATENAISAVAKICQYNHSQFNVNEVLPVWIKSLPILKDREEAQHTYTYLLQLVEA